MIRQNADDAFYELQNPTEQIQAYVFDGNLFFCFFNSCEFIFALVYSCHLHNANLVQCS